MMYASTKDFFKSYLEGLAVELQVGFPRARHSRVNGPLIGMSTDGCSDVDQQLGRIPYNRC